jgi:nitrate/nitrite-specific signal transduction histidine kinase
MGLRIMAYRAELIGAAVSVSQTKGGGTAVICTIAQN